MHSQIRLMPLFLCLPIFISCSTQPEPIKSEQPPSLKIEQLGEYKFPNETVIVFRLIPKGRPSGNISLKSVQNGQVEQFTSCNFHDMTEDSSIALRVTDENLDLSFHVRCPSDIKARMAELPPERDVGSISSFGVFEQGGVESVFWGKSFSIGKKLPHWTNSAGSFDLTINDSIEYPTMKYYVLTVAINKKPKQASAPR